MKIESVNLPVKEAKGHLFVNNEAQVYVVDGETFPAGFPFGGCQICGQHPSYQVMGDAAHVQEPCPHPDGITTTITLSVPSGKLLVSDDLRPVYNWPDDSPLHYNSVLGRARAIESMAAIGCAYGPASDRSLGLYRTDPDRYIIATPWIDFDNDETPSIPEDTLLADMCTDVWAYSIADYEHWILKGGDPETLDQGDTIVNVTPGTYRFIHHSGERGFDLDVDETVIFAHVEQIA
ncbi:hypothetical protein ABZ502_34165 [Streptomyces abikoensis]|uniref:hypothetical protein n=1 Tax=Streptomyces abikoensis TaxID=97398 RepID=UPI00340F8C17